MEYKGYYIYMVVRRIVLDYATITENGDADDYFDQHNDYELSRWYYCEQVERGKRFRSLNALKKRIDKLARKQAAEEKQ